MWSGAVLAGGRSRRFGQDKSSYIYRGKPLLDWVLESFSGAAERFVVTQDLLPGGGSLSGVHTAIVQAHYDWVGLAGCDQPFLVAGFWAYLLAHTEDAQAVAVVDTAGNFEPLGALYHKSLIPVLEAHLTQKQFSLQALLGQVAVRKIPLADVQVLGQMLLLNANTPQDLP
jgi:molybdenum cofactor guanylyltransferase